MALQPDLVSVEMKEPNPPKKEKIIAEHILKSLEHLDTRSRMETLPSLVDWKEWDPAKKLEKVREILSRELWEIQGGYTDDRAIGTKASKGAKNKYHTFVTPWLGQCYREFGKEKFDAMMVMGQIDPMVREMRERGVLKPGLDLKSEVISVASSTGSTQYLWQYDQGLQVLEKMREVASKSDDWAIVKEALQKIQDEQSKRIKYYHGFAESDVIVRMQSGSDLPLLNALTGSRAAQITAETGTASLAAARARNTSQKGVFGHARVADMDGMMPELVGFESVEDAVEIQLREPTGEPLDPMFVRAQTELWIQQIREKFPDCRITLGVTAGGKTGLDWRGRAKQEQQKVGEPQKGGLQIGDALELRTKYGGKDGLNVLIAVDNAQGRLDRDEITKLKKLGVMIDGTGSKVLEGPIYSAYRYFPPEYVNLIRANVRDNLSNHDYLKGLSEYVTQSDMSELLGDELMAEIGDRLNDIPDIFSVLKWESPLRTVEEYTLEDSARAKIIIRDFVNLLNRKMDKLGTSKVDGKIQRKLINGHTWEIERLDEIRGQVINPHSELLMPFRIKVDGIYLKEPEMRAIHKSMAEPGESGRMVNIGQYVSGANVLRIAPGMMSEIGLCRADVVLNYGNELSDIIVGKLEEVMESRLKLLKEDKRRKKDWNESFRLEWEEGISQEAYKLMEECVGKENLSVFEKVDKIVGFFAGQFRSGEIMPIQLLSGKSAAALDLMYLAWERSGRGEYQEAYFIDHWGQRIEIRPEHLPEDLPIVFVDHPYVLKKEKDKEKETGKVEDIKIEDSVYAVLCASLKRYPHTHLDIWGAGETIVKELEAAGLSGRYTPHSEMSDLTDYEKENLEWYWHLEEVNGEEEGREINEQHKGVATDLMIEYFMNKYKGKVLGIGRGVRPGQQPDRKDTLPINVSQNLDFIGLHLLASLSEDEIAEWTRMQDVPTAKISIDWLKRALIRCGLDQRFEWVLPQWYIDMIKAKSMRVNTQ